MARKVRRHRWTRGSDALAARRAVMRSTAFFFLGRMGMQMRAGTTLHTALAALWLSGLAQSCGCHAGLPVLREAIAVDNPEILSSPSHLRADVAPAIGTNGLALLSCRARASVLAGLGSGLATAGWGRRNRLSVFAAVLGSLLAGAGGYACPTFAKFITG